MNKKLLLTLAFISATPLCAMDTGVFQSASMKSAAPKPVAAPERPIAQLISEKEKELDKLKLDLRNATAGVTQKNIEEKIEKTKKQLEALYDKDKAKG